MGSKPYMLGGRVFVRPRVGIVVFPHGLWIIHKICRGFPEVICKFIHDDVHLNVRVGKRDGYVIHYIRN